MDPFHRSINRVRQLFSLVLLAVALMWLLVVPAAQMLLGYRSFAADTRARTSMAADRLSSYVASRTSMWEYEGGRLAALTHDAVRGGEFHPQHILLRGVDGSTVLDMDEPSAPAPWLSATVGESVTDGHQVVARLEITYSLYALVRPVLVALVVGLASMLVLLGGARMLMLRALDRAMAELDGRGRQLAEQVGELERTRAELALQLQAREEDRRKLAQHAASLEMAANDFAQVAQIATHHLQEPLRTVLSYAQLLVRWQQGDAAGNVGQGGDYLAFIKGGVHRMKVQMRALAAYASLREADYTPRLMDLGVLMDEVVAADSQVLDAAGASVRWGELPVMSCHPERLRSVMGALVESALRWRRPGQPLSIVVEAGQSEQTWLIRVTDDGRPLAERDPSRLFHLLVHDEPGSVSVGLAPARLIAFLLGGALWAEDAADGTGACFCLTLPIPE